MTKDVVTDETKQPAPALLGPLTGQLCVVDAHEVQKFSLEGWQMIRPIQDTVQVVDWEQRNVSEAQQGFYNAMASPRPWDGRTTIPTPQNHDPRLVVVERTVHVPVTRFLMQLVEASALAAMHQELCEAKKQRDAALTEARVELKKAEDASKDAAAAVSSEFAMRESKERLRQDLFAAEDRRRKMEAELGARAERLKKLEAALGELRVKEILGE